MPRVSPAISSLTGGEWSPQMYGQIELAGYPSACRLMRNFVCRVHGGAQKRPGTIFIAEIKDSTHEARLIPFQYSTEQSYCIEAGDVYMRFFKDRGQIAVASVPYEIGMVYVQADIAKIRFAQDKDLMYLFHQDYPPQKLIRNGHTDWEIANVSFINGPYLPELPALEQGTNLITNGDCEDDSNWTTVGSPIVQVRSAEKIYDGTYSRRFMAHAADAGIKSDAYTTTLNKLYKLRFRVLTFAGTFKIKIHQGSDSGTYLLEETIANVPSNKWTEYERTVKETAAGTGGYIEFLTALTASITGYFSDYPYAHTTDYVKATSEYSGGGYYIYKAYYATDPTKALTGGAWGYSWLAGATNSQRFNIDLTDAKVITRIYYENYHSSGGETSNGVQNFTLWGSNTTGIGNTTWLSDADMITAGWTQITTASSAFAKHAASDAADPKYIATTSTKPYRYYSFKFVDNWGSANYIGVRRIELQEAEYEADPNIYIDKVEMYRVDGITMAPSAKTGLSITLTASEAFFEAGHIGAVVSITHTSTTGYAKITSITSSTVAVADVIIDFGDTTAVSTWKEGAWSGKNGYPSCGAFYEQRLMCAASENDPDVVWGSKTTEYENFTPGTNDADPVSYKLQSDIIRWISAMGQLVVGTVNAEYRLGSENNNEPLSPTNIKMTQQSRKGCADIDPVNCGNTLLFVQRRGNADNYGKKLRELSYNFVNDSYDGIDLTLFAEHISSTGFKRIAFMSSPFPILWACTADGKLIGMTYEREQKVIGWHYHPIDGLVEDICVIPGTNQDDLYMIVNRTINGATKRYIEVMSDFDWGSDAEDCFFVDCGLSAEFSTPTTSITGLSHLEGETVAILADGIVQADKVVSGGAITLDTAASNVHVGLSYTSELEPLDLQGGALEGTSQGKVKRIHGVSLYLYQSMGGEIGQDSTDTERIFFKDEADYAGVKIPLCTDIKDDFNFSGDWQLEGRVYIKHDDPLPFTVLSILPRYRVEDR